ncbi:Cycloartenol synthase [Vitis vinifera]|uniref:Cycloartenol synthase n=1 Tax=Vitis vinifera TaxID=29760 RepID=A0A438FS97_VITVI|nr:Cycloartenol synthase [Vitis vinifera]
MEMRARGHDRLWRRRRLAMEEKIGEKQENGLRGGDGGNDPYIYSTNTFMGRQIWEFDADYGTLEKRAEFARENPCVANLPQIKVQDLKEAMEQVVTTTVRRGLNFYSTIQAHDGHWPGDCGGHVFLLPGLNEDGGWGYTLRARAPCLVLCYVTLRLLGEGAFGVEGAMEKGEMDLGPWECNCNNFLGENVVLGAYEWSGNNPLPPEVWLCPYILPVHPVVADRFYVNHHWDVYKFLSILKHIGICKKIKEYLHCEVIFPMS